MPELKTPRATTLLPFGCRCWQHVVKRIPFKKDIATREHDDIGSRLSQQADKHR
jgi:hypothetical protein